MASHDGSMETTFHMQKKACPIIYSSSLEGLTFLMTSGLEDLRHTSLSTPPILPRSVGITYLTYLRTLYAVHQMNEVPRFTILNHHNQPFPRLDHPFQNSTCLRPRPRPP